MTFLFSSAAAQSIPAGTDRVSTSGYSTNGKGAADYIYDPAVDTAYVAANPRTSFRTTNARGFRLALDQTITPFMFGTAGASAPWSGNLSAVPVDDTATLQAFFNFCMTYRLADVNWGGTFGVTSNLYCGGVEYSEQGVLSETAQFDGVLMLVVKSNIVGAVLSIRTHKGTKFGPIFVTSPDYYASYAGRLFDVGVLADNFSGLSVYDYVSVSFARIAGFFVRTAVVTNYRNGIPASPTDPRTTDYNISAGGHVLSSDFYGCGSGSLHAGSFLTSTYTNKTDIDTSGSYAQRTILTVATLPPALVEDQQVPILIRIRGTSELYAVREIDRAANKIRVFPWIDIAQAASGTIEYVYGGGLVFTGADSNVWSAKSFSTNCSAGLINAALYNPEVNGTYQNNLIATIVGSDPDSACLGGSLAGYFEGNTWDLVWNGTRISGNNYYTIRSHVSFNPNKVTSFQVRYTGNGKKSDILLGLIWNRGDAIVSYENTRDIEARWAAAYVEFGNPSSHLFPLRYDNPTITVEHPGSLAYYNIWGYRARIVKITGTGTKNAPAGTIYVNLVDPTKKINGVAGNKTFTGFNGPVEMMCEIDPADPLNNVIVSFFSGKV